MATLARVSHSRMQDAIIMLMGSCKPTSSEPPPGKTVGALTSFLLAESLGSHVLFLVMNRGFLSLSSLWLNGLNLPPFLLLMVTLGSGSVSSFFQPLMLAFLSWTITAGSKGALLTGVSNKKRGLCTLSLLLNFRWWSYSQDFLQLKETRGHHPRDTQLTSLSNTQLLLQDRCCEQEIYTKDLSKCSTCIKSFDLCFSPTRWVPLGFLFHRWGRRCAGTLISCWEGGAAHQLLMFKRNVHCVAVSNAHFHHSVCQVSLGVIKAVDFQERWLACLMCRWTLGLTMLHALIALSFLLVTGQFKNANKSSINRKGSPKDNKG